MQPSKYFAADKATYSGKFFPSNSILDFDIKPLKQSKKRFLINIDTI